MKFHKKKIFKLQSISHIIYNEHKIFKILCQDLVADINRPKK